MGIMKSVQNSSKLEGPPWYMSSGLYKVWLLRVVVSPNDTGEFGDYNLTFQPTETDSLLSPDGQKPPTPLDIPDLVMKLDANDDMQRKVLFAIVGTPQQDGNVMSWDSTGYISWNGYTDDKARFTGFAEVQVTATPPNLKKDGSGYYWPAKYKITDIDAAGTADQDALRLGASLAAALKNGMPQKSAEPTPPVIKGGKVRGK